MRWLDMARVRLRALFSRHAVDEQLDADLQFHLEQATAEYVKQGLSREGARRAALRAFGNPMLRLAIGLLLGVAGVLAGGRLVASMLFGLRPDDPATITSAAMVLIAVALVASILPAFRASRLDPAAVLRD